MVLGQLCPLAGVRGPDVTLAQAISQADNSAIADLSAYLVMECKIQTQDVDTGDMVDLAPDALAQAIQAWAFIQQNQRDGDV
jgi:hypothetical protein